jgi:hypothetical protein
MTRCRPGSRVPGVELGSDEPEPSRNTAAPAVELLSTYGSAAATATGGRHAAPLMVIACSPAFSNSRQSRAAVPGAVMQARAAPSGRPDNSISAGSCPEANGATLTRSSDVRNCVDVLHSTSTGTNGGRWRPQRLLPVQAPSAVLSRQDAGPAPGASKRTRTQPSRVWVPGL